MESVGTYIAEMLIRTGIFQKSSIDTIYSILKSSKRSSVKIIFRAIVKDNSPNLKMHIVEKEVKNTVENTVFYKQENLPKVGLIFYTTQHPDSP